MHAQLIPSLHLVLTLVMLPSPENSEYLRALKNRVQVMSSIQPRVSLNTYPQADRCVSDNLGPQKQQGGPGRPSNSLPKQAELA